MATKTTGGHQGRPTEESLRTFSLDPTQLLQCVDCGAWVRPDKDTPTGHTLETHVDRRPKVTEYRVLKPYKR